MYYYTDMLNSQDEDIVSFCITDPHQTDNPVIYISEVSSWYDIHEGKRLYGIFVLFSQWNGYESHHYIRDSQS